MIHIEKILNFLKSYKDALFMVIGSTAARLHILNKLDFDIGQTDVDIVIDFGDEWKTNIPKFVEVMRKETGLDLIYIIPDTREQIKEQGFIKNWTHNLTLDGKKVVDMILESSQDNPKDAVIVSDLPLLSPERVMGNYIGNYKDSIDEYNNNTKEILRIGNIITCFRIMGYKPYFHLLHKIVDDNYGFHKKYFSKEIVAFREKARLERRKRFE